MASIPGNDFGFCVLLFFSSYLAALIGCVATKLSICWARGIEQVRGRIGS